MGRSIRSYSVLPRAGLQFVGALLLAHICKEVTLVKFSLEKAISDDVKKLISGGNKYDLKRWYYSPDNVSRRSRGPPELQTDTMVYVLSLCRSPSLTCLGMTRPAGR